MDQIELKLSPRRVLGKKTRFLRREGVTPVHVYGHGVESLTLQSETTPLQKVLSRAGQTSLISLKIGGEAEPRTVLTREVQKDALTGTLIHVDFYQVSMKEKLKVEVPLILVGEAPALKNKDTMLIQEAETLTVECLPALIPQQIEVDVSTLVENEQALRVRDIKLGADITAVDEPEVVVARIAYRPQEVVEEKPAAVVAPEAAEAAAAEPAEEKPAEEK